RPRPRRNAGARGRGSRPARPRSRPPPCGTGSPAVPAANVTRRWRGCPLECFRLDCIAFAVMVRPRWRRRKPNLHHLVRARRTRPAQLEARRRLNSSNTKGRRAHYLREAPRVTQPPWKLEAWGMAHVSLETTAAVPDSTVTLPDETVTRAG